MSISKQAILEALGSIQEPDLKKDIVTLNLVKIVRAEGHDIELEIKVSNPAMHARMRMKEAVIFAIQRTLGFEFKTKVEVIPISGDEREGDLRKVLRGVKNIIAVTSGKGGVGKSTISTNLAVGLAQKGYSVGYLDADIYGPSAPLMFDLQHEKPKLVNIDGTSKLEPILQYGVKVLSIGFFADLNQAVVWRGPMATKALTQMVNDAHWGPLDYLILDLPPGTGDVHLSIVQQIPLTAALIVSTPQPVALIDAAKAVAMFQLPAINVPILGFVENMAWFSTSESANEKIYLFGQDGTKNMAADYSLPLIAQVPLIQGIREAGDVGRPAILQEDTAMNHHLTAFIGNFEREMRMLPFRKQKTETA
jgi:ATP-binding protein involved in chromosome partitioning